MKKLPLIFKKNKLISLKSEGASMLPVLLPGDIIYIKRTPPSHIKVDDIVFVNNQKIQVVHRVVYKKINNQNITKYFITKGDNNFASDGKISPSHIDGRIYKVKRNGKTFNIDDLYLFQSGIYLKEIIKISKILKNVHIDFIILKGLPLHLYYEKTHPRRIYADCDLLIRLTNLSKAKQVFEKYGYKEFPTEYSSMHKRLKNKVTEINMFKKVHNMFIFFDIHLEPVFLMNQIGKMNELYPEKLISQMTEEFFAKKELLTYNRNTFPLLSSPHLIMYLSLHYFHHNYKEGFRLKLISEVIKRSESQNVNIFKDISFLTRKYKVNNFVYPVFLLLKKYNYCYIPNNFLQDIKPNKHILYYINKNIINSDIFSKELQVLGGIQRFKNIFFLSPNNFFKKIFIFTNISVLYSLFWVVKTKIKKMYH